MAYTWTELLDNIKSRSACPTSQNTFTSDRFLVIANDEMRSTMIPLVNRVREGYFSYDDDRTIDGSSSYYISTRAIGGKLENAALINGNDRKDLARYYDNELNDISQPMDGSYGLVIKRNSVTLLPYQPSGWATLRMTILLRPSQIISQSDAAQITAINTGTKTVTCTTVPSSWTAASVLDIVQQNPHFDLLSLDQVITAVTTGSGGTITFSSSLPSRLAVGDWVSLAGQTPVIMLPLELHPLFAQACACTILRSQGDLELLKEAEGKLKTMKEDALKLITPRIEKEGKKLVNRSGMLRRGL